MVRVDELELPPPPPQANNKTSKTRVRTSSSPRSCRRRIPPTITTPANGRNTVYSAIMDAGRICATVLGVVAIVSVVVAGEVPGVTCAGEKLQLENAGSPEQENWTGAENPPACGATVIVKVADCPALTVSVGVVDGNDIEKSWITVSAVAADVLAANSLSPP